jgi:hypothetical protein
MAKNIETTIQSSDLIFERAKAIIKQLEAHPANRAPKRDEKRFASKVAARLNKAVSSLLKSDEPSAVALNAKCGPNGYYTAHEVRDLGLVNWV